MQDAKEHKITEKHKPVEAPPERWFWVHNGPILGTIADLERALDSMSEETFLYHVNEEKNDLALWVHNIMGDTELACNILAAKTRQSVLEAVRKKLRIS